MSLRGEAETIFIQCKEIAAHPSGARNDSKKRDVVKESLNLGLSKNRNGSVNTK